MSESTTRRRQDVRGSLRQDEARLELLGQHLAEIVDEVDGERVARRGIVDREVARGRQVVARVVDGLPAAEHDEARLELELDAVVVGARDVRGRDVANDVAVVNVDRVARQELRELLDAVAANAVHVVEAREGALERRARVVQRVVLLDGDVAPVRDLDLA